MPATRQVLSRRIESASGSDDPQYWYLYDEQWRPIATFRQSDTDPKERFVFHCAGVAGSGGSSYIDAVILRDYDDTYEWNGAGDGSFEQRTYLLQNWRADVVAILDPNGEPIEHVRYSPYGVPSSYPLADVNRDGLVDSDDYDDWDDMFTGAATNAKAPVDLNGDGLFPDTTDYDLFLASYHSSTGMRGGYNKLGATIASSAVISPQNRIGYAGYQWDPAIKQYHVRHRVYNAEVGRWTRRDPAGYVDGISVYEYVSSMTMSATDPTGLWVQVVCCGTCAALGLYDLIMGWSECISKPTWAERIACGILRLLPMDRMASIGVCISEAMRKPWGERLDAIKDCLVGAVLDAVQVAACVCCVWTTLGPILPGAPGVAPVLAGVIMPTDGELDPPPSGASPACGWMDSFNGSTHTWVPRPCSGGIATAEL